MAVREAAPETRRHRLGEELCFALFSIGTVISERAVCSLSLGFGKDMFLERT